MYEDVHSGDMDKDTISEQYDWRDGKIIYLVNLM